MGFEPACGDCGCSAEEGAVGWGWGMASMWGGGGYGCCRPLRRGQAVPILFLACRFRLCIGIEPETKWIPSVPSGQQLGGLVTFGRNDDRGLSTASAEKLRVGQRASSSSLGRRRPRLPGGDRKQPFRRRWWRGRFREPRLHCLDGDGRRRETGRLAAGRSNAGPTESRLGFETATTSSGRTATVLRA